MRWFGVKTANSLRERTGWGKGKAWPELPQAICALARGPTTQDQGAREKPLRRYVEMLSSTANGSIESIGLDHWPSLRRTPRRHLLGGYESRGGRARSESSQLLRFA